MNLNVIDNHNRIRSTTNKPMYSVHLLVEVSYGSLQTILLTWWTSSHGLPHTLIESQEASTYPTNQLLSRQRNEERKTNYREIANMIFYIFLLLYSRD